MNDITRRAALTALFGASVLATGAFGQERDLQPEVYPSHPYRKPYHPTHPTAPSPVYGGPVQVSLTPIGPSTISIGQPLKFRLVSFADGYAHLYVFSASGRSQLWMENVRLHSGAPLIYPRPGMLVRAAPPAGDEVVMFVATRGRIAGFLGGGSTSMTPVDLQVTHDGLRNALQGQLDALPRDDWAVAELTVRVTE